jgi:hypothetical protein
MSNATLNNNPSSQLHRLRQWSTLRLQPPRLQRWSCEPSRRMTTTSASTSAKRKRGVARRSGYQATLFFVGNNKAVAAAHFLCALFERVPVSSRICLVGRLLVQQFAQVDEVFLRRCPLSARRSGPSLDEVREGGRGHFPARKNQPSRRNVRCGVRNRARGRFGPGQQNAQSRRPCRRRGTRVNARSSRRCLLRSFRPLASSILRPWLSLGLHRSSARRRLVRLGSIFAARIARRRAVALARQLFAAGPASTELSRSGWPLRARRRPAAGSISPERIRRIRSNTLSQTGRAWPDPFSSECVRARRRRGLFIG